jgi:phage terminase large subunit-like protein
VDRIVAERNQGGDFIESMLRSMDRNVAFSSVHATRGKYVRAEPVSALYERGRTHHVGKIFAIGRTNARNSAGHTEAT